MLAADGLVAVVSARILTDGAYLSDGTHMSGDEVRDTVLASVGLWRDEAGVLVATQASPGGRHLALDPASQEWAESDSTSGPVHLAAAVARYLATVTHPDDRPLRPGQRWLLMLDGGYPSPVTVSPDGAHFVYGDDRRVPVGNWPPGTRRYLSEGVAS